jgi:diguanylate cyclase (GGDEF)-like protein
MGGDEFVLLLLGNDQSNIADRIEQLRQMEWPAGTGDGPERVSISVGAALYPKDGSDADQLLAEADRRMYKAKQAHKLLRTPVVTAPGFEPAAFETATIQ